MYYDREYLEARLDYYYSLLMTISKGNIDVGIRDLDTLYFDLNNIAPAFVFRDRDEQYEYRSIVRDWNSRFRAEVDHYLREHDREEEERAKKRRKKEEEKRREEEEILMAAKEQAREEEMEEERRRVLKEKKRKEEESKRKEQDKQNRAELLRIQEQWRAQRSLGNDSKVPIDRDSIFCISCGAANTKTAKFCTKCGTQLQTKCPSCGKLIRVGSKFCTACGSKIGM